MALQVHLVPSPLHLSTSNTKRKNTSLFWEAPLNTVAGKPGRVVRCTSTATAQPATSPPLERRTANYRPPFWRHDFVQTLKSPYSGEKYTWRQEELKEEVRSVIKKAAAATDDPLAKLELVDVIEHLGVGYHFQKEIKDVLGSISVEKVAQSFKNDMYSTALLFRVLREHSYQISQDVFQVFRDENGKFSSSLHNDVNGLLSLYEASYFAFDGETTLDEARLFTIKYLNNLKNKIDENHGKKVKHALEFPLNWRVTRFNARWFIDIYEREVTMNPILLELAKLDFNIIQCTHVEEMKEISRWWSKLALGDKLSYFRDRVIECYFIVSGFIPEPEYKDFREMFTKLFLILTIVDDTYDVYGTVEELEKFTEAFERWDTNGIEELPLYMKVVFLMVFNTVNEMAYYTLREKDFDPIPYLKRTWAELCKAYLVEAKWYHEKHMPTFKEYMSHGMYSSAVSPTVVHSYCYLCNDMSKEALEHVLSFPVITYSACIIFRLLDDLVTSKAELERGDVPKALQCYMDEYKTSEEVAREHIMNLVIDAWKKLNKECFSDSRFPKHYTRMMANYMRGNHFLYQYGDGYGSPDEITMPQIISMLIEPIPMVDL